MLNAFFYNLVPAYFDEIREQKQINARYRRKRILEATLAHDFLYVGLPSQTSRINNKRVISTFKFGYPRLTLKEGSKVNSDNIRRFAAHDFL